MNEHRPNPDKLLQAIQKMEQKSGRGKLRVFLGMCPGVGKTYAMLKAAREQQNRGVKVAIGVVETHGRKETQELLVDLAIIPRREIEYKGSKLTEMDIDRIIKDRPPLVLIDELAHTNAPGSRHLKRYQDVEEILSFGIDVYTTVNIQHIESRNDQIAQITGVSVRETVPDSFFEYANQIEVVDLSPDELLRRLKEGKVYLGDRAERAEQNFFKEEYLTALRELALRFTAEKVDQDLHNQMMMKGIEGPWNTNERLLVAVSYSPYSSRLIRATRRMAYNLEAPWVALYVDSGENLNDEDKKTLKENLDLARELGAEVITIVDTDLNYAIQKICHEKNVTQIVMGRPDRRFFQDLFARGTLLERLVRTTSKIDVHVIRAERTPRYRGFYLKWPHFTTGFIPYWYVTWFLLGISFFCYAAIPYIGYRALGSVFLLAILVVASLATKGPIFFSAFASAFIWNYFFIPPQFTFEINSWEDSMMVISFFVTALVGGLLTARIKRQESILQQREERTLVLYDLSRSLATAKDVYAVTQILQGVVNNQFNADSVILLPEGTRLHKSEQINERDFAVATWTFEQGKRAGWSTQTLSGANCLSLPLVGKAGRIGVLAILPKDKEKSLTIDQENFLNNIVNQIAVAIERLRFVDAAQQKTILEASEKLHQALINSVSHELRTPLTAIIGTSTALRDEKTLADKTARDALTEDLVSSARRLDRVVENLLDMSRLEKGTLQLKKEWFEIKDLVDEVKNSLGSDGKRLQSSGDLNVLVNGDFKLLQHSLYNIVTNSLKYAGLNSPIEVKIRKHEKNLDIAVIDSGPGIPKTSEDQVFDKFYRVPGSPAGGLGLGLSIVKSIIELHGGETSVKQRDDGKHGAHFSMRLPIEPTPPELTEVLK